MKKSVAALAIFLGWAPTVWSAEPATLTTLHAIAAVSNAEASHLPPVVFPATVIYCNEKTKNLNVQENDEAIFVRPTANLKLVPGDRVMVSGTLQPSFLPYVISNKVTVIGHGAVPEAVEATYDDLLHKKLNCRLVTVRGQIRSADLISSPTAPPGRLQMLMDGGYIDVEVDSSDVGSLKSLIDSDVEITGTAGRKFDGTMQQVGAKVKVTSLADIKVIARANADPWSLPITPLNDIVMGSHLRDLSRRLRVHGTITYYQPGSAVVLQNDTTSLWVSTQISEPMQIGDVADATGFPEASEGKLMLAHAEIKDSRVQAPVKPLLANWRQLAFWGRSKLGGHQYDLVSIEGRVVTQARESMKDEYVLVADNREFTAIFRHPLSPAPTPAMPDIPVGTTIRVTGICLPQTTEAVNDEAPFDILIRSFDDVQVVSSATIFTVRNMAILSFGLFFAVLIVGARGWLAARRSRSETNEVAYLERRRRHILEEISSSRSLPEIVDQITELVSFKLKGAPCWCEIAEGGILGNCPEDVSKMRVVQIEIPARSGPPFGTIFAAFPSRTRSTPEHVEAVSMGAGLASLAIGTRRLYSDLVHRSEFDLLTDIQNRFSMEKNLDNLIEEARRSRGVFGLIYIDLDGFKQINDRYGHHVGDIYLQEAAARMKRQLRPADILARLGGDEFAVLVPVVSSRAELQEIADRLERCYRRPFTAHKHFLKGAASIGIALYPEDAKDRDDLLRIADHAMYVAKNARKAQERRQPAERPAESNPAADTKRGA